jgi:hypothetical protein
MDRGRVKRNARAPTEKTEKSTHLDTGGSPPFPPFRWAPPRNPSAGRETSPPPAPSPLYNQHTDAPGARHDLAMPPLLLLLAALALAQPHGVSPSGGGFYDPNRVTQISWRPRSAHPLRSFHPTCPARWACRARARHLFADLRL